MFVATERIRFAEKCDAVLIGFIFLSVLIFLGSALKTYYNGIFLHQDITLFPGFLNVRFFSQYQIWTLPIIVTPIYFQKKLNTTINIICYLLGGIWWGLAFSNGSKGLLIALSLAMIGVVLLNRKMIWQWFKVQFIAILLGGIFFLIYYYFFTATVIANASPTMESVGSRLKLWEQALHLFSLHWLLGVGPLHFAYYPTNLAAHPHNLFLLILSEWGLIGALLAIILLIRGCKAWFCLKAPQVSSKFNLPFSLWVFSLGSKGFLRKRVSCSSAISCCYSRVRYCIINGSNKLYCCQQQSCMLHIQL